jgi:hypothetical protein
MAEAAVVVDGVGTIVAVGPRAEIKPAFASLPEERAQSGRGPARWCAGCPLAVSAVSGFVPV